MKPIDPLLQIPVIRANLRSFFANTPEVARNIQNIGAALHYHLVDCPGEFDIESVSFVEALYKWICRTGGMPKEWLIDDDGRYTDDKGTTMDFAPEIAIMPGQQLAAYGLWLLDFEMPPLTGELAEAWDMRQMALYKWTTAQVKDYRFSILLLASQALSYAYSIRFSVLGKAGAQKRHAGRTKQRTYAIGLYRSGTWHSANQAAHALTAEVNRFARENGIWPLSPENAQRTLAEWFRKADQG